VDPAVLVGIATHDDAAVYRFGDEALVATVDVFTPIVDDPFDFGRIAAANSLSDVYAMGARPLFALSFIGYPTRKLPLEGMAAILRGAAAVCTQAGIAIIGGHSIDDAEPKFGLSVTGAVAPDRVVRNSTGRPGDVLVLTKPIGTGVLSQALKQGVAPAAALAEVVAGMAALNRDACAAMLEAGPSAATDVTGFGLLGHLHEVAHASGLRAEVDAAAVPLYGGARAQAEAGLVPGGSRRNADYFGRWVRFDDAVDAPLRALLCDAQTSGGLLIALPEERVPALVGGLERRGVVAAVIGRLVSPDDARPAGTIAVRG
jgi:selenide,water dikinase